MAELVYALGLKPSFTYKVIMGSSPILGTKKIERSIYMLLTVCAFILFSVGIAIGSYKFGISRERRRCYLIATRHTPLDPDEARIVGNRIRLSILDGLSHEYIKPQQGVIDSYNQP